MTKTFLKTLCLSLLALVAGSAWAQNVAKIGDTGYETFADAMSAVQDGDVIYLLADTDASNVAFTPTNGKTVIIAGKTGNEILNMGDGHKGGIQNATITFLNLKMQIRHTLTSGTWYTEGMYHAKKIKYENVVFDGVISTYNDVDFLNCTFTSNPQNMEYTTWNYGGTQIFKGCKFLAESAGTKSFIKLYNQGAPASVAVVDCEFINPATLPSGWKGGEIYNSNPAAVATNAKQCIYGNKVDGVANDDIVKCSEGGNDVKKFDSPEAMGITLPTPTKLSAADLEIGTADELLAFAAAVNAGDTYAGKTVVLTADIDLTGKTWTPIGNVTSYPGVSFAGLFDGQNHTISNLTCTDNTANYACAGFFGSLTGNAVVKDLTLTNVDIQSTHYAGGICAYFSDGAVTINNCTVNGGTIKSTPELIGAEYDNGDKVGGIMGYGVAGNTITGCTVNNVTISAYRDLGGIAGYDAGNVENCTVTNCTILQDNTNAYKESVDTYHEIVGRYAGASLTENTYSNVTVKKAVPVVKIGTTEYTSLAAAVAAARGAGEGTIEFLDTYDQYPQAWVTDCVIEAPETMTSSYTFHAFNPTNGDEDLAIAYKSNPSSLDEEQQERANEVLNQVEPFADWYADFEVSFDADMTSTAFSIGGQYGGFPWIDGLSADLKENEPMRLLGSVGGNFTYQYMMMEVFQFHCGITGIDMSKLAGHTFSVDLYMYDPSNENVKILVGTTKYTFPAVIIPEVEETLVITTDEQQTIPDDKKEEVAAAVITALTQNSSVNNMTAEETNINNAVLVSEDSERRLKVELTSAVVGAETITEQTTTTTTTVKGATFEVKPVYVYENGQTVIIDNKDIIAPITFRLAVQKNIQDDCAKVWHQAVVYDQDGKASADPNSPKEYLGVFPIQTAANGEKYIQLSASKFSFYNYLTKSMEQIVAQIGDVKYETLAEAIAAVPTDGTETTITMIADETIEGNAGVTVAVGQNIVLNLNDKTITQNATDASTSALITNNGTLTINDTDTEGNGKLVVNSGVYSATNGYATNVITNCGDITINGGTFENKVAGGACYALDNNSNGNAHGATATVNGGSFIAAKTAVRMFCNSTTKANEITWNDGVVKAGRYGLICQSSNSNANMGKLIVKGGEFSSTATDYPFDIYFYGKGDTNNMNLDIQGGIFKDVVALSGDIKSENVKISDGEFGSVVAYGNQTGFISGGTYQNNTYTDDDTNYVLENCLAEGFQLVANDDGTYGIEAAPVAKIGETEYKTLADAIAAVPTNGTETIITMLANEAIDVANGACVTIVKEKKVILDLNGFEIAGVCSTGTGSALIVNKGGLTIKDSSTEGTGKMTYGANPTWIYDGGDDYSGSYASNLISNFGTLTIESGYFENAGTGSACYAIDNNSNVDNAILTVNGGTIKGKSTAVRQYCNSTTTDNTVNVNGGTIEGGYAGIWIQLPGSGQAKKAALNVTGGTLKGTYAFYDYTYGDVYDAVQYNLSGGTFDGYIFSFGANMTITDGTYYGEIDIEQTQPSRLSVTGGKFSGDICAYGDNASTGFISGGVYKDYTFEYEQQTYGCYWFYSIDPRYEAIYNTDEATKEEYPYTVGLKEQIIIPEVEEETLDITPYDEQQTIPDDKKEEVAAAVVAALTQNSSVNNMTAEETNINNAVPVSETHEDSERRLKVELTSAVVAAETITEQTTTTTTTVKGATFEVKPVYVYEEGGVTKTEIVRNEDIKAPITFRLAVQKNIQDDCAKVWHQAVVYDQDGKAEADPNSPKEYLGVFPIQTADNGEKYIQLSASKFSFYNYLTKSMEQMTFVAQIGDATFETLAEAIAAVKDGETITMIADVTGANGISVESGKNFTVDFDGHTYTLGGDGAGSTNTKTSGFQLLEGSTITFKNGTINCSEANKNRTWTTGSSEPKGIAMLIQNYANLTLDGMTIDGSNIAHNGAATRYVVSNNSGDVNFTGATTITAADGDFAFDVYKYGTYPVPTVTIADPQVIINGNIEAAGGKLNISAGTVNGTISTDTGYTLGDIAISGGSFSEEVKAEYCATGFQPVTEIDAQGMYTVKVKDVVLHVYGYENKEDMREMRIPEFLDAQQAYPNAMAVVSATYSEDVEGLDNVILDYAVGKGHYYECENFVIDDMADFWYSPVSFVAISGYYTRHNLTLYNSVCVPFEVNATNAPEGATLMQYRYSDEQKNNVYFEKQTYITAGQGFLMKANLGTTWFVEFDNTPISNSIVSGAMTGSYVTKTIGAGYFKVNSDGDKFTKTKDNSYTYPFRSYLDLTGEVLGDGAGVQSFNIIFDGEGTTGILGTNIQNEGTSVYDINGTKQNTLQRGVNVVRTQNGYKKVIK